MKVTIIVPVYNDFSSLEHLVSWIEGVESTKIQFLILDNGSTDQTTWPFLQSLKTKLKIVRSDKNLGFGGGVLHAAHACTTEWIGWMPGNLKIHPRDVNNVVDTISDWSDNKVFKCRRIKRGIGAQIKTFAAGVAQSLVARTIMYDTGGTPTICTREFLLSLPHPPATVTFESFIPFAAKMRRMKIERPRIPYGRRIYGSSHWQKGFKSEVRLLSDLLSQIPIWRRNLRLE